MKAFLTWNGQVFRKIHSLVEIGEACAKLDPGLAQISSRVAPISAGQLRPIIRVSGVHLRMPK
jgi:hypothetical protein